MLNELITWVLNTYLGKYLEDFNPDQLSIALVSGEVELENVPIRKDALRSFGIPVQTLSGSIGRIKLQIPVRQFRTSPWSIVIERVYGVFGPKDISEWDSEKEKEAECEYKMRVLDAKEANWRVDNEYHTESYYSLSYSSWVNYGASLATNILENLELKIMDVHLRYEDTVTIPRMPVAAGIRITSITAQSSDSNWIPGAKNSNLNNVSFKLLELKELLLYWDKLDVDNMCSQWSSKDLLENMNQLCKFENHKFLTNPVNATAKFKRERCRQAIRNKNRPRISCDVVIPEVKLALSDNQYKEMVKCVSGLYNINEIRAFRILRPSTPVSSGAKVWWQYAAKCHGFTFLDSEQKWKIAKENMRYISIYKRLLQNPSENMSKEDRQLKVDIERSRSIDDLKMLRDICCDNINTRGVYMRNRNIAQGKGILYHWFPNWLGWYGTSSTTTNATTGDESQLPNDEAYKNIEDDILTALKETIENETFSKRDSILGNFTFALSNGRIALTSSRAGVDDVVMLDMELKNLFCFIEVKPKLTSYRVGISLGSVSLNDKYTEATEYPYLVKPQNQENQNHKSLYSEFLNLFTRNLPANAHEEPWFQLQYERSPPEHQSDCRLIIKSKSIDVVYNETAFKWLVSFFTQPMNEVKSVRRNVLDESKQRTSRLKFFKNWKSMLIGQTANRKKWSFEIDISAPRIICVENFHEKNASIVLIDFGRFQLFKNERSANGLNVLDADARDKDSDDELFMTPCSTPPGSKTSRSVSPTTTVGAVTANDSSSFSRFVINSDTGLESEFYCEIYDKYIINLNELQVLVCKNRERGYACSKTSSNYHLLDKFNITLHLERRIVNTSDPEYPSIKLFGNLDKIVAHINEQKISECLKIISPITLDVFKTPASMKSEEKKREEDIVEGYEHSNTTIFQFVIGQVILEVQSREKSIAEMQIIGAKASITKKSCEVNINMSVHGFLLVDAIQSFGPDFELLIASHRHVEMDSISGSLKQSEPCSPTSPGSPDPNGYHRCASPQTINLAVYDLHTEIGLKAEVEEALITIDYNFINSPNDVEPIQIANITFNNLDVIANQETIVELLGFGKRILDSYRVLKHVSTKEDRKELAMQNKEDVTRKQLKTEISFDFHRLNILVLRSARIDNITIGRKVGTLTMSEAKIHATLGPETSVAGALGGIQIIDVTPEGLNHQRIFSVGMDPLTGPPKLFTNDVLYTLTNEMYGSDMDDDDYQYTNALSFKISQTKAPVVQVKIRMASVWYTHCPRFIEEIYLCVKEFRQYFKNFVKSLRSKASFMAKGFVQHISHQTRSSSSSRSSQKTASKFGELALDIILSSPVLVLPRSCQSNEVLVANLGKITVCNRRERLSVMSDSSSDPLERDTYFIDVRNINLFSLNTSKRKGAQDQATKVLPKANEMYSCHTDAVPILHDTALLFQCIYESKPTAAVGPGRDFSQTLLIDGSVTQNLHVCLSRCQYEQLIESLSYATHIVLVRETPADIRELQIVDNVKTAAASAVSDTTQPSQFHKIRVQFSVPILKLDLKNEHNISLVHLTFEEFSFKNITTGCDRVELQVYLRSVVLEDLKCAMTSKFRNLVNSSSEPPGELKAHAGSKLSTSCPDLLQLRGGSGTAMLNVSVPSSLHKMTDFELAAKDVGGGIKSFKKIDPIAMRSKAAANDNLVIYRSIVKRSPQQSNGDVVTSSIDFNCLNLIISTDKWFMVFDFFGLISYANEKGDDEDNDEPMRQAIANEKQNSLRELNITVRSLNLILVRDESELAKANVSNVQLYIKRDDSVQLVEGRLGSLSIYDLTPYGRLYQEKFTTTGEEALSFTYKRIDKGGPIAKRNSSRSLEKDALLLINMSSVRYVHTKRFVVEFHMFVKEVLQLQSPVMSRIKSTGGADAANRNSSTQIGLEIHAESPIILLPVGHDSNHLLIADLGKITLENSFHYSNDVLLFSESHQAHDNGYNEIVDLMSLELVNINLLTGERESKRQMTPPPADDSGLVYVGNMCIIKLGDTIFKEKCHLKIQVIRNTECDISHNIPDIRVKATLSELNGLLNVQQFKLVRGFLNCNLGEIIDDVYHNYRANLNESLERLCSMTKVNVSSQTSTSVWNNLSINFILDNVTISLAEPFDLGTVGAAGLCTPLACIKFIKSTLEIDSFSDGSQDIDLISSEILLMDARDSSSSSIENCFKYILKPSMDAVCKSLVQAEVHIRKRNGLSKYTVLLNNMRIMVILDYLERLKDFLNEEPYTSGVHIPTASTPMQHSASVTSEVHEDNSRYEFVLNITNSEVVFVERCNRVDTNAIILKSTTVFSYKPYSNIVPISIDINHLEIFSCILGSESESSLSIIDPFSLNMELRNNCFQVVIPHQVYLRVSYNDVMLFTRMMRSIPQQTDKRPPERVSQRINDFEKIAPLVAMGFKQTDCWLAMQICHNNLNESAIWLSQQKSKASNGSIKVNTTTVNAHSISICIIDDCLDADVPLLEVSLSRLSINVKLDMSYDGGIGSGGGGNLSNEAVVDTFITSNYYNRRFSGWEPIIESWECCASGKYTRSNAAQLSRMCVQISSKQILRFNITSTLIELCELVHKNWTEDYFVRTTDPSSSCTTLNVRQRLPFVPFALKNLTGEPLLFKIFYSHAGGITRTEVTQQDLMCNWISARPDEIVPFDFGPQNKWRHLDSHKLNMHQILVQIHGWTLIGPISIDKVGTFFRYANFDMQYSKKTRIVFDIALMGSAQKLITVRSALNIVNNTKIAFQLQMKTRGDNEIDVIKLKSLEKITTPLRHIDSLIYLKPLTTSTEGSEHLNALENHNGKALLSREHPLHPGDANGFCTRAISWLNCISADAIQDTHSLFTTNRVPFHVLSEIRKDNYPVRELGAMPGHTVSILPPLRLKNLLCCDLLYKVNDHTHGRISASAEIEIYSIDIKECFCLTITLDNYKLSGQLKIPMGHSGVVEPKLKLIDLLNRELFLRVSIQSFQGRGMEIFIGAPIWIINRTGLPLIFRQEGTSHPASGQFEEHEYAREVSPLMFSFSDQEGSPLLEFRLGMSYGTKNPWCKSVGLQKETTFRELKSERSSINYVVGVSVERGKSLYCATTFVTLSPRFQLYNRSSKRLQFAQKCDVVQRNVASASSTEAVITALPGSNFPFHWSNGDQEPLLCVRVADDDYCRWSNGLPVNAARSLYINLRNELGEMTFLRLEVMIHGGTFVLHFTDAHTLPPPIRVDNFSEVSIHFSQKGNAPMWRTNVKPQSSLAYVLDDPLGSQTIRIEAPGGNSVEYPLKNNVAKSLTYANFIYIAFKETFRHLVHSADCDDEDYEEGFEGLQLVLGVKDKRVIITRKCSGDRSQLWLMNSYGQLEHEGSSPPTEFLKSALASPRLVLDLEKPPNPTEYTKLVVRPQNNQRVTTQTWRFENGRLMCHANMCVQAANGLYGLQPGCDAVLGRIESNSRALNADNIPYEQSVETQKLRPGSGHLEVVSKMDGPIKSIQIHDIKCHLEEIVLTPDPLWKHASIFSRMLSNNTKEHGLQELLIKLTLTKGLGLSIVTRSPCEELAYLTFEDIVLDVALLAYTKSLDLKVGHLQIDNQLVETSCPITFYTSKSSSEEESKNAVTLEVKLLPSPNKNAVIFEYLLINLRPCFLLLEERLILKMALFLGYGCKGRHGHDSVQQPTECSVYKVDDYPFSKNDKRFYFENLAIGSTQVRLTVLTAPKLNNELMEIKKSLGLTLIKFEDAVIEFDKFSDRHHFETLDIYVKAMKVHYVNQLKWHAASILGSVDFLGNPLGFANDLSEGVSGLIFEGSVKSLVKNVTHGISNSTAKLTETLSDSLGRVVLDEHDNETRQKILEVSYPTTGSHLAAGLKGFGFGLLGGVTSIARHTYVGAQSDGFPGFLSGLGKGLVGTLTKPLIGVLDLASETASAVRETSRGSHHCLPDRKRLPRCVTGAPGGLLPNFSYRQSKGQQYLYIINRRNFGEKLIFYEPNLCNDKEAKLRLLVSTEYVRIFSRCEEDPAIMIECHLSEVLSCHPLTTQANHPSTTSSSKLSPCYYIEISTNLPKVTRPRVRCQNEEIAERASRCINYAKAIYDEREHSLLNI